MGRRGYILLILAIAAILTFVVVIPVAHVMSDPAHHRRVTDEYICQGKC